MGKFTKMKWIGYNENIVNMLGCITIGDPLCLVLEFMPIDLMQYLRNRRLEFENCYPTTCEEKTGLTKDFMQFAWQIADGMRYLSSKGIVHRDLAARNILVDEEQHAKICDFGLCIQKSTRRTTIDLNLGPDQQKRKSGVGVVVTSSGRLPIKWLAIESLQRHEFSVKSDVWSYGLLLFEIYSFGEAPFSTVDTKDMLRHLQDGGRPEKPEFCSLEIYEILQDCWAENPEERPTFQELLTKFTILLERTTENYGYLAILKDCSSDNENHTVTASSHASKLGRIAQSFCFPRRTGSRASSESDAETVSLKNVQRRHTSADIKITSVNHLTVRQKRKLERKVSSFDDSNLTSCRTLSYSVNSESNLD
uniref:Protein kinase domain-containing protein n=1 Tax=Acrobeloides nanus TaxID=290746 RepID=A0A914EC35_9BILA